MITEALVTFALSVIQAMLDLIPGVPSWDTSSIASWAAHVGSSNAWVGQFVPLNFAVQGALAIVVTWIGSLAIRLFVRALQWAHILGGS